MNSVASGAAYLVETDRFDSQAGAGARYMRGVLKAFLYGHVRARCGARVGAPLFLLCAIFMRPDEPPASDIPDGVWKMFW